MAKDRTAKIRKRRQRARDKRRGMTEVSVRVPKSNASTVKSAAARARTRRK